MIQCTAHCVNCWPPSKVWFANGDAVFAAPLMSKVHGYDSVKLILTGLLPDDWEGPPTILNDLRIAKGHELQML